MDGSLHACIDWQRAWLAPLRNIASAVLDDGDWRDALTRSAAALGLRNHRNLPIVFAHQEKLNANLGYESHISGTGQVPTRANLHDFFNALVWLAYPASKARLNAIQAAEIMLASRGQGDAACAPINVTRGRVRDRATIFDENAALLLTLDPAIAQALREHDWREGLLTQRASFGVSWEIRLFGHALMEKLVHPYKAITAHVAVLAVDAEYFTYSELQKRACIDRLLDEQLQQGLLAVPFAHLPVLGVPGWWENQDAAFYADAAVFRPKRVPALIPGLGRPGPSARVPSK